MLALYNSASLLPEENESDKKEKLSKLNRLHKIIQKTEAFLPMIDILDTSVQRRLQRIEDLRELTTEAKGRIN